MKNILVLLIILMISSCIQEKEEQISIAGVIEGAGNSKVFLKYCNPFQFNSNSTIIATADTDETGSFNISVPFLREGNLILSANKNQSRINEYLMENPENFGYSFCSNFLITEPTFFVEKPYEIKIHLKNAICPIEYEYTNNFEEGERFNKFYRQLGNGVITELIRKFKSDSITLDEGYSITNKFISDQVNIHGLNTSELGLLNGYLYSELVLGSYNNFLIWSKSYHKQTLQSFMLDGLLPKEHEEIFEILMKSDWSIDSTEYYKLCENYVTFFLNKRDKKLVAYYENIEEKATIAYGILPERVRNYYVENLKL